MTNFTATFTIQSPAGTVTGTKDSTGVPQNDDSNNCDFAGANSNYVATITPTGQPAFIDTGNNTRTQVGNPAGLQNGFWEGQFRSNSGPPPPPPVMFAPGGGSFTIGDLESANGSHVTFWGAQWSKANPTSGGASAASFKGFAENPSMPNCNTKWSTDPGNSAPPPNGPLPPMMGVIVTSQYSKSGSMISGNTLHIVIVQTDPGYQPNPGHPGTGTVVMQVC